MWELRSPNKVLWTSRVESYLLVRVHVLFLFYCQSASELSKRTFPCCRLSVRSRFISSLFCSIFYKQNLCASNWKQKETDKNSSKWSCEKRVPCQTMEDEKLNKPTSRKSSSANGENGKGKDITDNSNDGGGDVALKAKMSLLNGCTVIVGSIIGKSFP